MTAITIALIIPAFSLAESSLESIAINSLKISTLAAKNNDLKKFKQTIGIRIGKTDLSTPTPNQTETLFKALMKIPIEHTISVISRSLEAKYFDNRDHSIERILISLKVKAKNSVDKEFKTLCTETFNCMNNRDARRGCITLAD